MTDVSRDDAYLTVVVQGGWMRNGFATPIVTLDGRRHLAGSGPNHYSLRGGRWIVGVSMLYHWEYGRSSVELDLEPGQVLTLHYATPWHWLARGALGPGRQRGRGLLTVVVLFAAITALVVLAGR